MMNKINTLAGSTSQQMQAKEIMAGKIRATSIPNRELMDNLGLYLSRQTLSRINFIQTIYEKIIPVHGVIMEFGVRWGQNMSLFTSLRGLHEPYNYNRKIIGFDTFEGFPSVSEGDGPLVTKGDYGVTPGWKDEIEAILDYHESMSPIPHKKKYHLLKGDATQTLPEYLREHPETIVALAYFDFDIYEPTKYCLEAIIPHITKGTLIAFDELNCGEFPGETKALKEVFGLDRYSICRCPNSPLTSYIVIGD